MREGCDGRSWSSDRSSYSANGGLTKKVSAMHTGLIEVMCCEEMGVELQVRGHLYAERYDGGYKGWKLWELCSSCSRKS